MIHIKRIKHNPSLASKFDTNYQINQNIKNTMYYERNIIIIKQESIPAGCIPTAP